MADSADWSVSQPGEPIAWFAGDIDHAFEVARASGKPLFLYWGASWCPPCNRIKATVFKRRDFVERSRRFVAYYLDGDSASAQKLAARFKVTGYPTVILFGRDGAEVTRLPGEQDHEQYLQALSLAMDAARPARAAPAEALGTGGDGAAATAQGRMQRWRARTRIPGPARLSRARTSAGFSAFLRRALELIEGPQAACGK